MGHVIIGFKTRGTGNEISSFSRGSSSVHKNEIYNALECHDYFFGVSGNGNKREFTKQELIKALEYLKDKEDLGLERKFLKDCLDNVDLEGKILVGFY